MVTHFYVVFLQQYFRLCQNGRNMQNNVNQSSVSTTDELKNNGKIKKKNTLQACSLYETGLIHLMERKGNRSISCKLQRKTKKHFNASDSPT
jgi:hypothetical protein